jgi:tRNA modification GTPase
VVRNKIDLDAVSRHAAGMRIDAANLRQPERGLGRDGGVDFAISASRGDGLSELVQALVDFAHNYFGSSEQGLISRERQRTLLHQTADALQSSMEAATSAGEELVAEELRVAADSLGRLLGRVDVEDILDKIFREFCIGK